MRERESARYGHVNPIANSNLGYEFCKGYYSRVTDAFMGE